jgi:hypothetical protein
MKWNCEGTCGTRAGRAQPRRRDNRRNPITAIREADPCPIATGECQGSGVSQSTPPPQTVATVNDTVSAARSGACRRLLFTTCERDDVYHAGEVEFVNLAAARRIAASWGCHRSLATIVTISKGKKIS